MLYNVEGIVLRAMDYGEAGKIVTLFTRELGKVGVMARGAKKLKSRHGAATQLFTYGRFQFFKGGSLGNLSSAEIEKAHHRLREDLHLAAYAAYVVELVDRCTGEGERHEALFEQLLAALSALEEGKDPAVLAHILEMKALALSGYMPQLDVCVACGNGEGEPAVSARLGGLLCARCRHQDREAIPVTAAALKVLRLFRQVDVRRLGRIELQDRTKEELKRCLRAFMDQHMDVRWKSRNFLDQLEKYGF